MVELKVRLGPKGQVVIPKIFRESYKLYPNQVVVIRNDEDGVLIKKQDEDIVEKLREIAKKAAKKRKGKKFRYDKMEIYEQYDERARRAGIKV